MKMNLSHCALGGHSGQKWTLWTKWTIAYRPFKRIFFLFIAYACILLTLTGCILPHRQYHADVEMPEGWRVSTDEACCLVNLAWWRQFGDPVLDDYIDEALVNNRDLKIAAARVLQFYAQLGIARSYLFPTIQGNASAMREKISTQSINVLPIGVSATNDVFTALVNFVYDFDLWGRIRSATYAATSELFAQEDARRGVLVTLVSDVAASYIFLRQLDKQLEISQKTEESREESLTLATLRFDGGLTSEVEVKQAASEVETAKAEVVRIQRQIGLQEDLLSVLLGRTPDDIVRGRSLDRLAKPFGVPAGLPVQLLSDRPDILEAEQQLIASGFRVSEAKAGYFPDLQLTGQYGNVSLALKELFTGPAVTWNYALSLAQTIFDAGRTWNQVLGREAEQLEALFAYEQAILVGLKEVNDALIAHEKAEELLVIEERLVEVLKDYRKLAQIQYDNGETDYLNVLDAERKLFAAELDHAAAQGETFLSLVALYKALGAGWNVPIPCSRVEPCKEILIDFVN